MRIVSMLGVLLVAAAAAGACSKTPDEPKASTRESAAPRRCIKETPKQPPPPVPAGPDPSCPPDDTEHPPHLPIVVVPFPDAHLEVKAELARAPEERRRGLMFRKSLAEDRGMLFRMGERTVHNFWMQNTCIPLDMLFVDDDGTIVGIYENAPTLTEDERGVGCASSWVLEMNAGWSRRHGVVAGQKITIPGEAKTL